MIKRLLIFLVWVIIAVFFISLVSASFSDFWNKLNDFFTKQERLMSVDEESASQEICYEENTAEPWEELNIQTICELVTTCRAACQMKYGTLLDFFATYRFNPETGWKCSASQPTPENQWLRGPEAMAGDRYCYLSSGQISNSQCYCNICIDDADKDDYAPDEQKGEYYFCADLKGGGDCVDNPNTQLSNHPIPWHVNPDICFSEEIDCNNASFSACAKCINPGAEEVCDNLDNDCEGLTDITLVSSSTTSCSSCCSGDKCVQGSCKIYQMACNTNPSILGLNLGILYGKDNAFELNSFENQANCREGVVAGTQAQTFEEASKISNVGLKDAETKFEELKFAVGDDEKNLVSGLIYKPTPAIKNADLPVQKTFWLNVKDTGTQGGAGAGSDQKQVSALLCPLGKVDLGTLTSEAVWAGGNYSGSPRDFEDLLKIIDIAKVSLKVNKFNMQISPGKDCGSIYLIMSIELKTNYLGGDKLMSKIKAKLRSRSNILFDGIVSQLPKKGDGNILVSISSSSLSNQECSKFSKVIATGDVGGTPITVLKYSNFEQTIKIISDIISMVYDNAYIDCDHKDENDMVIKSFGTPTSLLDENDPTKTLYFCNLKWTDWLGEHGPGRVLKGWTKHNLDGSFELVEYSIYKKAAGLGGFKIAYDQARHVKSTLITPGKLIELLKCCNNCDKSKINIQSSGKEQSIYALRTYSDNLNGYAYQFFPSPLIFNKEVTKTFSSVPNGSYIKGEIGNFDIVKLDESSVFNNCKIKEINSISSYAYVDKNNTMNIGNLEYEIPEGALSNNTNITIKLLDIYDCLCNDEIQNGDETGIDCGGSCSKKCEASCYDEIQNGDETGIDCGGSCLPCDFFKEYPNCSQDSDCSKFCEDLSPNCVFNTCFCTSCGDGICGVTEYGFNLCKQDCPYCYDSADVDGNCIISLREVLNVMHSFSSGQKSLSETIDVIRKWEI